MTFAFKRLSCWIGMISLAGMCRAGDLVLFSPEIKPAPIVVAEDSSPEVQQSVRDLARYIEKMSGFPPAIIQGRPDPLPKRAIWVGLQDAVPDLFPKVQFTFSQPEEILIASHDDAIVIAGRDRAAGGVGIEYGTANAVYTFIQKNLGVRWLWPGPLGEDVPQTKTLSIAPIEYRFHPQFRQRKFRRRGLAGEKKAQTEAWYRLQRLALGSFNMQAGHAFVEWWAKYHEQYPEYFALQADGTRRANPRPEMAKLCVSNPKVSEQWLINAEEQIKSEPARTTVSASPNDGSIVGDCVCETCRSWDDPNGPAVDLYSTNGKFKAVALTDRYVKFWNILARGLQERYPERNVFVGAYAYGPYLTPPVSERLERNIAIGFVGHFPLNSEKNRETQKAAWKAWAEKAAVLTFRPNMFWYTGGPLGLPVVALKRTAEDFRFLAENKCIGFDIDLVSENWSTQGVQIYLMAQLAYDPLQDANQLIRDYYQRGFGKGAKEVEQYFTLMEGVQYKIIEEAPLSSGAAKQSIEIFRRLYPFDTLKEAEELLETAASKTAGEPEIYRKRIAFIRQGLDFTKSLVSAMNAMAEVRTSNGADHVALEKARQASEAWQALLATDTEEGWPLNASLFNWFYKQRKLVDELGPPSDKWLKAEQTAHPTETKGSPVSNSVDAPF